MSTVSSSHKPSVSIAINVPFREGSVPGCQTVVGEGDRQAYLAALERETIAAREDAKGYNVSHLVFVGGTAANMRLDTWCRLMEKIRHYYGEVEMGYVRFDVAPDLVNQKTAAYAFKYRSLFNMVLGQLDAETVAQVASAKAWLDREHVPSWGVTLASGVGEGRGIEDAGTLSVLLACEPGFVRVEAGASMPTALAERLAESGYRRETPGFSARLPRYKSWFAEEGCALRLGFGLGSVSAYPEGTMVTTQDAHAYIEKAGLDSGIYTLVQGA